MQPHQEAAGNNELHDKLLPGKQAQVAVLDDLDIVIQKTDKAGTKRQEQRQQGGAHLHNAQKVLCIAVEPGIHQAAGHQNAKDEAQAAHGGCALFLLCQVGPDSRMVWPKCSLCSAGITKQPESAVTANAPIAAATSIQETIIPM